MRTALLCFMHFDIFGPFQNAFAISSAIHALCIDF